MYLRLCFKTGNISILKGGSDADNSNRAIIKIIHRVLSAHNIDVNFATLLPVEREATEALLNAVGLCGCIDTARQPVAH
jgi:glutamate-5-semialdehyde dehydrogenase